MTAGWWFLSQHVAESSERVHELGLMVQGQAQMLSWARWSSTHKWGWIFKRSSSAQCAVSFFETLAPQGGAGPF